MSSTRFETVLGSICMYNLAYMNDTVFVTIRVPRASLAAFKAACKSGRISVNPSECKPTTVSRLLRVRMRGHLNRFLTGHRVQTRRPSAVDEAQALIIAVEVTHFTHLLRALACQCWVHPRPERKSLSPESVSTAPAPVPERLASVLDFAITVTYLKCRLKHLQQQRAQQPLRRNRWAPRRRIQALEDPVQIPERRIRHQPDRPQRMILGYSLLRRNIAEHRRLLVVRWLADGVNLTFRRDMTTRAVVSVIDAAVEHPEQRTFKIPDLPDHLLRNRPKLVSAGLTILSGYRAAGSPDQNLPRWGGFNDWTHEIRDPLVWLGCADPFRTRERIVARDPERQVNGEVLHEWHKAMEEKAVRTRDVIEAANEQQSDLFTLKHKNLKSALLMIAESKDNSGVIDARRLGNWCSTIENRVIDGLRLVREQKVDKTQLWRVCAVSANGQAEPSEEPDTRDRRSAT